MTTLTFQMPLPPNQGNRRGHWRVGWQAKKDFYAACDARQNVSLLPAPPSEPWDAATLSAHFYVHNLSDPDNLHARLKFVQDWLVTRGYIVDDSPAHLTLVTATQEIDRKDKRLHVTLAQDSEHD